MVSATLSQLLERARVRFGVEVEIFDARLKNLYPEGGTDLSRVIEDSSTVRSALMDALAAGRPHRLDGGGLHYRIYPLSRSKRRQPTGLMAIRRNQSDPAHALDAEPWSDLARAIVEADLAATDSLGEERERSRRLVGALRFLEVVIDTTDEAALTQSLVQAAAVWFDVDARVYRRSLAGDLVLHTWLPGVRPEGGAGLLSAHLVGSEVELSRTESWGGLGADGTAHEAVLVPLTAAGRAEWVLALFGNVPPEGDTVLRLVGRVAGTQLAAIAARRQHDVRTQLEALLHDTTKAPELLAVRIVHELAHLVKASSASLTLVRNGHARRIAAVGPMADSPESELQGQPYSGDRFTRLLALGANDSAVLDMRPAAGTPFTADAAAATETCVAILHTWLRGALASFDAPSVLIDAIVPLSPAFSERIQEELERARRFDLRLALVLIDVEADPNAVAQLQEALRRELRGSDVTGKMSGSLVVALLTHTDAMGLDNVVRRLKQRLTDAAERLNVSDLRLGQAAVSPEVRTADALLALALRQAEPLIVH